jgi:hypothetical protein
MPAFKRSLPSRLLAPAVVICCLVAGRTSALGFADEYVVIVSKANPANSISSTDLRKMFLGEKTTWTNGVKVMAITPGTDRPEFPLAIEKATGMSGPDFKRYFIQLNFSGKSVPLPRTLDTTAAIARFVGTSLGAVSCVPAADVGPGVKILKVK